MAKGGTGKKPATGKGRGRRAASPTRDETVDVSTGPSLLLGGNLPKDAAALQQFQLLANLKAKSKRASQMVSKQKKTMEGMGLDVKAHEDAMILEKMDPTELASYLKELARMARLRGMPVQMQLFEPKYDSVEAQAKAEGLVLGKGGKSPDTARWGEGQSGHAEHLEGWNEGQKQLVEGSGEEDPDFAEVE